MTGAQGTDGENQTLPWAAAGLNRVGPRHPVALFIKQSPRHYISFLKIERKKNLKSETLFLIGRGPQR